MLSRVADALYWMGRYLERAEHSARVLEAMHDLRLDLFEIDREVADEQWQGALRALSVPDLSLERLVLDPGEPTSLLSAMSRARENARQVQEVISPEMWERLNQSYWVLREGANTLVNDGLLSQTLTGIVSSSFLWDGVTDASMIRGEGWLFLKLGKFMERAVGLCRLVAARADAPGRRGEGHGTSDNVTWLSLLKSLDALDAYRKAHPKRVDRHTVLDFLLFEADFPRSLLHSTGTSAKLSRRLLGQHPQTGRRVEQSFGRVAARVEYADFELEDHPELRQFFEDVLAGLDEASGHLQRTFFLY